MSKIIKGDNVVIVSGRDKGKRGVVLKVIKNKKNVYDKAIVSGVNICYKHKRSSNNYNSGEIVKKEHPLNISKVALLCKKTDQASKVGYKINETGDKVRICKKSMEYVN